MPARSRSEQRLFGAAEHGATFPKARELRDRLTRQQLHDFASGSMQGKPERVPKPKRGSLAAHANSYHPGKNLGRFLHPRKAR